MKIRRLLQKSFFVFLFVFLFSLTGRAGQKVGPEFLDYVSPHYQLLAVAENKNSTKNPVIDELIDVQRNSREIPPELIAFSKQLDRVYLAFKISGKDQKPYPNPPFSILILGEGKFDTAQLPDLIRKRHPYDKEISEKILEGYKTYTFSNEEISLSVLSQNQFLLGDTDSVKEALHLKKKGGKTIRSKKDLVENFINGITSHSVASTTSSFWMVGEKLVINEKKDQKKSKKSKDKKGDEIEYIYQAPPTPFEKIRQFSLWMDYERDLNVELSGFTAKAEEAKLLEAYTRTTLDLMRQFLTKPYPEYSSGKKGKKKETKAQQDRQKFLKITDEIFSGLDFSQKDKQVQLKIKITEPVIKEITQQIKEEEIRRKKQANDVVKTVSKKKAEKKKH